ncbi:MAG TPA: hypothetical protein VGL38_08265 [bacterium]|jgi:hypothetical protein
MKKSCLLSYFLFHISYLLLSGCASAPPQPPMAVPQPDARKLPPARGIVITSSVSSDTLEWGLTYNIPLDILWVSGRRIPVRLQPGSDTPGWLKVGIDSASFDTTASATVHLTPLLGQAPTGKLNFVLEAVSDSLPQPVRKEFRLWIQRQTGPFTRLAFGIESQPCDSLCAHVSPFGELAFYDLRHGQGAPCSDTVAVSDAAQIGLQGFALSPQGFALGASCRVAAVYEASGALSFVNLGIAPRLPVGAVLLSLRGANACWLSPDNTVALISMPGAAVPYDIASGRMIGGPCHLTSDTLTVRIHNGRILRAGLCKWELQ